MQTRMNGARHPVSVLGSGYECGRRKRSSIRWMRMASWMSCRLSRDLTDFLYQA